MATVMFMDGRAVPKVRTGYMVRIFGPTFVGPVYGPDFRLHNEIWTRKNSAVNTLMITICDHFPIKMANLASKLKFSNFAVFSLDMLEFQIIKHWLLRSESETEFVNSSN